MLQKRIIYFLLFVFFTWLALATRQHNNWFHPIIVKYGGDVIWAGMFLFFVRIFFAKTPVLKLAIICYVLGVADEFLQLYQAPWIQAIRHTYLGKLMLGVGFLWSDIICYAIGILLAIPIVLLVDSIAKQKKR